MTAGADQRGRRRDGTQDFVMGGVSVASVWLAFYLLMVAGALTAPFLAQAVEFAALY